MKLREGVSGWIVYRALCLPGNASSCVSHSNQQLKQLVILFGLGDSELTRLDNGLVQGSLAHSPEVLAPIHLLFYQHLPA